MNYIAVVGTLMLVVFFQLGPGKKGCSKEPNAKMLGVGGGGGNRSYFGRDWGGDLDLREKTLERN